MKGWDILPDMKIGENTFAGKQSGKEYVSRKAFEIAYILARVVSSMKNRILAETIEQNGIALLEQAAKEDFEAAKLTCKALELLIFLGGESGAIHGESSKVIAGEVNKLNAAIADIYNAANRQLELELSAGLRLAALPNPSNRQKKRQPANLSASRTEEQNGNLQAVGQIRQNAILEKIRQNGDCRMKDIQDALPDSSERTIRYDLQKLIENGQIERSGAGVSTFYRVAKTTDYSGVLTEEPPSVSTFPHGFGDADEPVYPVLETWDSTPVLPDQNDFSNL